jgi:transcriptional regulator of arginine metabolism
MPKNSTPHSLSAGERKKLIAELISQGLIASQGDVVSELKSRGVAVTQATASRDLQDLGALKGKGEAGKSRYALPASNSSSRSLGGHLITSVAASANIVVVKTPTAAAQFLAAAIDEAVANKELKEAIGTIAGDDTVLVIAATAQGGSALAKTIQSTFGKVK